MSRNTYFYTFTQSTFALLLCLSSLQSEAKLSVPYGADGSPPDADTKAAVDNYNNLLDGPRNGQSDAAWEAELQAAHDLLYAKPVPGYSENDLCESPQWIWMGSKHGIEKISKVIEQPAVRNTLINELQQFVRDMFWLYLYDTAELRNVTITRFSCIPLPDGSAHSYSALSLLLSVAEPAAGQVTIEGSAYYRHSDATDNNLYEWCLDVRAFDTIGFGIFKGFVNNRIEALLSSGSLCGPAENWDWTKS